MKGVVLSPYDSRAPKYWMHETSGVLEWVVKCYLQNEQMTEKQIAIMREYLKQWVTSPVWKCCDDLARLQRDVEKIQTQPDIDAWLEAALAEGIDPL